MNTIPLMPMLLAPWQQRNREHPWVRRIIYAVALLLVAATLTFLDGPPRFGLAIAIGLLLQLCGWLALSSNLLEQNHPHAARFVPGHLRRLRQAALLGWAVCSVVPTLAIWPITGGWMSPALLLLISSVLALFTLRAARSSWLWLVLMFGSPLLPAFQQQLQPLWQGLTTLWQANEPGLLLLALAAQAWLVVRTFGRGDAAHQARYARRVRMRMLSRLALEGKQTGMAVFGGPGEWVARPFERAASAWLRRALGLATPREASVMARAEIVLHGQQHWLRQTLVLVMVLVFVAAIFGATLTSAARDAGAFTHASFGLGIGLVSAGLNPVFALPFALWHSRREQALLRLLPGMPLGTRLNRAVARSQLRQFLCNWAITAVFVFPVAWIGGNPFPLWAMLAAIPVAAVSLTRAPARMGRPTAWSALGPAVLFFVLGGALHAISAALSLSTGGVAVACASVVALAAALLAWRWRRLSAAPMALPAGRLS